MREITPVNQKFAKLFALNLAVFTVIIAPFLYLFGAFENITLPTVAILVFAYVLIAILMYRYIRQANSEK